MADDIKFVIGVDNRDLVRAQKEQLKFQRNLTTIEKAFRSGKIDASRYNSELAKQAKELAKLGGGYNKANSEIRKYAASLRQANDAQLEATQAAGFAGKRVNRLGMQMQQAGYQVGDFAVQLQGGTNMMVALGQQGSQLLGIFGPAGAIAGAALAIGTAFVAPLMRAAKEADELAKSVKSAIEEVDDALRASMLGATEGEMKFIDNIAVLQSELDNLLEQQAADPGGKTEAQLANIASAIRQTKEDLGKANEEFRDYQANVAKLKSFDPLSAFGGAGRDIREQERLKTAVTETGELRIKLAFRRQKLFDAFRDRQREAEREEQDALEKISNAQEKRFSSQKESLKLRLDEANLQELYKDKFYIQNLMERQKILLQQQSGEITAEQAKELLKLTDELGDQEEKLRRINDQEKARLELIKLQEDLENKRGRALDKLTGGNKEFFDPRNESGVSGVIFKDRDKPDPPKEPAVKESDLSKLQKQLDLEDALLGKTEARQRVIQALGVEFSKKNPETVAGLEEQINKNLELVRVEQERIDLANTIGSAMEDSLMSMVDGTKSVKDAFRDMARDIVRHLYKVLVVQQMINSIGGMIGGPVGNALSTYGQADGGAWQGGSQIQAYANGGVVGGPTMFPMANGKTGLMGEAGPEAIMPLKRGANGKLGVQMEGGTGQNVVINQSFNFQANGDDSVKKIIAQAAPQIANMTKKSMLDDRRRGGTTKAVFG
jgi:hypothetical protein